MNTKSNGLHLFVREAFIAFLLIACLQAVCGHSDNVSVQKCIVTAQIVTAGNAVLMAKPPHRMMVRRMQELNHQVIFWC